MIRVAFAFALGAFHGWVWREIAAEAARLHGMPR